MKQVVKLAILVVLLAPLSVLADTIQFSTSGAFNGTSSSIQLTEGTGSGNWTIGFNGVTDKQVSLSAPSYAATGQQSGLFTATCSSGGCNEFKLDDGEYTFELSITQSNPSSGTDSLLANLSGQLKKNGTEDFQIEFTSTFVQIGGVTYALTVNPIKFAANSPSQNKDLLLNISEVSAVPEPASMFLFGSGILSLVAATRRRFGK